MQIPIPDERGDYMKSTTDAPQQFAAHAEPFQSLQALVDDMLASWQQVVITLTVGRRFHGIPTPRG